MRIHHLNCISTCPMCGKLMDGRTDSLLQRGQLSCHCLLLESGDGLTLIDTGMGLRDVAHPRSRLSAFFLSLLSPDWREEMTAYRQIERLGFAPRDVRHIVLSHLDFDHAGGIDDFPQASVHLLQAECDAARAQGSWLDRQRFRPQQWSYPQQWRTYGSTGGDRWYGFDRVRALDGLSDDVVLVPLVGHTLGHAGVAVRRGDGWLFHAADAYFHHREMDAASPACTPGLAMYQWMMDKDGSARRDNQRRLRELGTAHGSEIDIFCSHEVLDFERLAGRPAAMPAPRPGHASAFA